jgi:hypothetical protein
VERNKGPLVSSGPAMAFTSSELPHAAETGNQTADKNENGRYPGLRGDENGSMKNVRLKRDLDAETDGGSHWTGPGCERQRSGV